MTVELALTTRQETRRARNLGIHAPRPYRARRVAQQLAGGVLNVAGDHVCERVRGRSDEARRWATSKVPLDPKSSDAPAPSSSGGANAAWCSSPTIPPGRESAHADPLRRDARGRAACRGAEIEPAQDAIGRSTRILVVRVHRPQAATPTRAIGIAAHRSDRIGRRRRTPRQVGKLLVARRVIQRRHRRVSLRAPCRRPAAAAGKEREALLHLAAAASHGWQRLVPCS
jgi:hypothetical protein